MTLMLIMSSAVARIAKHTATVHFDSGNIILDVTYFCSSVLIGPTNQVLTLLTIHITHRRRLALAQQLAR